MLLASSLKTKRSSLGLSSLGTLGDGVYTHVVKYTVVPAAPCPTLRPNPYYYYGFTFIQYRMCELVWRCVGNRRGPERGGTF